MENPKSNAFSGVGRWDFSYYCYARLWAYGDPEVQNWTLSEALEDVNEFGDDLDAVIAVCAQHLHSEKIQIILALLQVLPNPIFRIFHIVHSRFELSEIKASDLLTKLIHIKSDCTVFSRCCIFQKKKDRESYLEGRKR
ncbi:hypothetical protein E2542_SST02900 [Spatholobus suberectus]|nr:hypothetical protein E2542_SST02900 [Spatholobus suberectus]